jgi:6,7-dimethyl-8-ribityllumazine synthase
VSEPYDRVADERDDERIAADAPDMRAGAAGDVLEDASENVLDGWPSSEDVSRLVGRHEPEPPPPSRFEPSETLHDPAGAPDTAPPEAAAEADSSVGVAEPEHGDDEDAVEAPVDDEPLDIPLVDPAPIVHASSEHAPGELTIPPGHNVLEGAPDGSRRAVGVVVSRYNGEVTSKLLESALQELDDLGVSHDAITVMPVPGAFELPIGAMALAKTRRFACIVALGCVIRGDTPHFDYVAGEAASGLQLAALETGVPVAFGVLTLEREDQAAARYDKGAEAVRTALEMADLFAHLRAAAAR